MRWNFAWEFIIVVVGWLKAHLLVSAIFWTTSRTTNAWSKHFHWLEVSNWGSDTWNLLPRVNEVSLYSAKTDLTSNALLTSSTDCVFWWTPLWHWNSKHLLDVRLLIILICDGFKVSPAGSLSFILMGPQVSHVSNILIISW